MTHPATRPVALARRAPLRAADLRPDATLWIVAGVAAALSVVVLIGTHQPWVLVFAPALTLVFWLVIVALALKPTAGTAGADDAGVHWSGRWGSFSYPWDAIDWIELAADQPGARLFTAVDSAGTTRTGSTIGVAVVVGGVPHYVHPVWTASPRARIDFGCALAAYARARGVRVRVLQGDWGAENVNREPGVGGRR